ncbi:exodeoxyribonuclease V subunit gamma [Gordonia soli]|uniref:RecBCD enzyme subunit RecC n=1 Tax=Gordonia soli NBRC 108243 TaxID=1223545 RepID=M0QM61_9ACTN|nr:exodeoxyribonuclease V subunit gamma [Gordonia soli]GAC69668.1 exodeoxyribonuclease V gamma chain [Gordonia soli NBRC 108243]
MFHLHRAERADVLADALTDVLAVPLADVMATEIVAVPARGVERWLQQHLAVRLGGSGLADGVAANIDFSSPNAVADAVIDAAVIAGGHVDLAAAERDPWRPDALCWPVLRAVDDMLDDPRMAVLARHLGSGAARPDAHRIGRRYATARHIAGLFHGYGRQRPDVIVDWAAGTDTDGAGAPVPADMSWQPDLWRRVRDLVGKPHPAEILGRACDLVRDRPEALDLPERLAVVGPTRLSETALRVLSAVAVHRDVHLFVPHPSPSLWQTIGESTDTHGTRAAARRSERPAVPVRHPLVASLSRDVQELQLRLLPVVDVDQHHPARPDTPATVLAALQRGIAADRLDTDSVDADDTVEIHACHGPERQVEVLRDRLLHLFQSDPTLQPRDVVVMCPDVETFAPLIRGAFGQPGLGEGPIGHPAFQLRVRLADRGLRQVNPILDVVAAVVELAAGRASAGDVVDLLGRPPVRARFALTDDDLDVVREWVAAGQIRWAIDDTQRDRYGLKGFRQGTFASGLDRIALGVVADESDREWLDTSLPLGGVDSTSIDLAGRLMEFVERLGSVVDSMAQPRSAAGWRTSIVDLIDQLTLPDTGEEWQRAQAIRAISEMLGTESTDGTGGDPDAVADRGAVGVDAPAAGGSEATRIRLADIRDMMTALVAGRPTRANFRTGELTVCSMVPMRAVPHRVVVLLGVDADSFPRVQRIDGDDLLGRDPLVGERSPRDEDRQLFLDAIGAASENLLVFYSGADPVSGVRTPPAVVVSELVDTVAALVGAEPDDAGLVRRHSLHAFDARNFRPGAVRGVDGPFGFDSALAAGARALREEPQRVPPLSTAVVGSPGAGDVDLADLITFLNDPIAGFLRQRLGARIPDDDQPHPDHLDVALEPLDRWAVGDRLLAGLLAGADLVACQAAELRRGTLPPFALGTAELRDVVDAVGAVFDAAVSLRSGERESRDIVVTLTGGRRVQGTIGDVFGRRISTATYSTLRPRQRLGAWVRLLALAAGGTTAATVDSSVAVGRRSSRSRRVARSEFTVPADPLAEITSLVGIRDLGLRVPLPLPLQPGAVYAERLSSTRDPREALAAARNEYERGFESTSSYLRLTFAGDPTSPVAFDDLLGPAPQAAAGVLDAAPGEPFFCALARTLWTPAIEQETRI